MVNRSRYYLTDVLAMWTTGYNNGRQIRIDQKPESNRSLVHTTTNQREDGDNYIIVL